MTSKENILVTSNQGTAIPTASTFGEKKTANREIPNLPPYPIWPRSWTNSWIPVCLRQFHQNTQAHSGFLGTDIPVQQHKLVLYFAFFFTQDYTSRIIFYLSATSHVHKLISLQDPYFLSIFRAKEAEYCPIHCLKNYINQRRKQNGHLSNCLSCILVAIIQLLWYWGIVYLSLTSRCKKNY